MSKRNNDDAIPNPKPKIGRKDREYKFSKKFEKQYGKKRRERQEEIKQKERLTPSKKFQEAAELGLIGSAVKSVQQYVPIIDKVAILANQYGIDGAADILNIDAEYLQGVIERGGDLDRRSQAILERGYADAVINYDDIDFNLLDEYATRLKWTLDFIGTEYIGNEYQDNFRLAVAETRVDADTAFSPTNQFAGYTLFAQGLDAGHRAKINDFIAEGNDLSEMFEAYQTEMENNGMIFFPVGDERYDASLWWAWFRETFYP